MKFLIDAQLPPKLADHIQKKGHEATHVFDLGLTNSEDDEIWNVAIQLKATIITKDEDFSIKRKLNHSGPSIIWVRIGNTGNQALLGWVDKKWSEVETALAQSEDLIEIV